MQAPELSDVALTENPIPSSALDALFNRFDPWLDIHQLPKSEAELSLAILELCKREPEHIPLVRTTLRDLALFPDIYLKIAEEEYEDELLALNAVFPSRLGDSIGKSPQRGELRQLYVHRLHDLLFEHPLPSGHMYEFSWLRLVCVLVGLFQDRLKPTELPRLLRIASHGWSESFENLAMCALILNAGQLVANDEQECRRIYAWIKSAGRSSVAMALAARYNSANIDFVSNVLRQTLNLPIILDKDDFMAFGKIIGGDGVPFTPDDLRKLTIVTRENFSPERIEQADESVLNIIESGGMTAKECAQAIDGYIHMRLHKYTGKISVSLVTLLRRYASRRPVCTVPEFLRTFIEAGDLDVTIKTLPAVLLLLLILESAETRRQFKALYEGVQLLENVDAIRWLTTICHEYEIFGPAVAPFVALIFVYAPELTRISRTLMVHDQVAWNGADQIGVLKKHTSIIDPRHGLLEFRSRMMQELRGHPYVDELLLQVHLLYEPMLQRIKTPDELEICLQDLYLLFLRSQRAMRMLHALRPDPDQRIMDIFAMLQEVCVARACLDYAQTVDSSYHRPLFEFLNDFLVDRQNVLKTLHWQGYNISLIDLLIDRLPVMRRCYAFLPDLLDRQDATEEKLRFSLKLATELLRRVPPTKSASLELIQRRIETAQAKLRQKESMQSI